MYVLNNMFMQPKMLKMSSIVVFGKLLWHDETQFLM